MFRMIQDGWLQALDQVHYHYFTKGQIAHQYFCCILQLLAQTFHYLVQQIAFKIRISAQYSQQQSVPELTPKKWKNGPQKLLTIGPTPFFPQSSPDHGPQPRIEFSYNEISGPDICSLICVKSQCFQMAMYQNSICPKENGAKIQGT